MVTLKLICSCTVIKSVCDSSHSCLSSPCIIQMFSLVYHVPVSFKHFLSVLDVNKKFCVLNLSKLSQEPSIKNFNV